MLENNANSNGMIVHWFIEAVCGGKESAFDIETPFQSTNMQQSFSITLVREGVFHDDSFMIKDGSRWNQICSCKGRDRSWSRTGAGACVEYDIGSDQRVRDHRSRSCQRGSWEGTCKPHYSQMITLGSFNSSKPMLWRDLHCYCSRLLRLANPSLWPAYLWGDSWSLLNSPRGGGSWWLNASE